MVQLWRGNSSLPYVRLKYVLIFQDKSWEIFLYLRPSSVLVPLPPHAVYPPEVVQPQRGLAVWGGDEGVAGEAAEEGGLADAVLANQDHLQ